MADARDIRTKRNRRTSLRSLIVIALLTAGCSDQATPPVSPLAPSASPLATVQAVRITPAITTLRVGESQQFELLVVLSDGIPPSIGLPRWASSQPGLLSLTSDGRAVAVAAGIAVLSVDVNGGRGLLEVHVID